MSNHGDDKTVRAEIEWCSVAAHEWYTSQLLHRSISMQDPASLVYKTTIALSKLSELLIFVAQVSENSGNVCVHA